MFGFKGMNVNQSISSNNGYTTITVNGKSKVVKGSSVSIIGNKIIVDGKEYKEHEELKDEYKIVNIYIEGNVDNINTSASVGVNGNVGSIDCGGSCSVEGDVTGEIDCGGSCTVKGNHKGNINAGGSVRVGGKY